MDPRSIAYLYVPPAGRHGSGSRTVHSPLEGDARDVIHMGPRLPRRSLGFRRQVSRFRAANVNGRRFAADGRMVAQAGRIKAKLCQSESLVWLCRGT